MRNQLPVFSFGDVQSNVLSKCRHCILSLTAAFSHILMCFLFCKNYSYTCTRNVLTIELWSFLPNDGMLTVYVTTFVFVSLG